MKFIFQALLTISILSLTGCKTTESTSISPVFKSWSNFDYDSTQNDYIHKATGFKLPAKIGSWERSRAPRQMSESSFAQTPYNLAGATATIIILKPLPKKHMKSALMVKLGSQVKAIKTIHTDIEYLYLGSYRNKKQPDIIYGPTTAYAYVKNANKLEIATTILSTNGFFAVRISYDDISKESSMKDINEVIQYLAGGTVELIKY